MNNIFFTAVKRKRYRRTFESLVGALVDPSEVFFPTVTGFRESSGSRGQQFKLRKNRSSLGDKSIGNAIGLLL